MIWIAPAVLRRTRRDRDLPAGPDGIRTDAKGNVYIAARGGAGLLAAPTLGKITPPVNLRSGMLKVRCDRARSRHPRRPDSRVPTQFRPLEYKLLQLLVGDPGRVFSREELLEQVWRCGATSTPAPSTFTSGRLRVQLVPRRRDRTVHGLATARSATAVAD